MAHSRAENVKHIALLFLFKSIPRSSKIKLQISFLELPSKFHITPLKITSYRSCLFLVIMWANLILIHKKPRKKKFFHPNKRKNFNLKKKKKQNKTRVLGVLLKNLPSTSWIGPVLLLFFQKGNVILVMNQLIWFHKMRRVGNFLGRMLRGNLKLKK